MASKQVTAGALVNIEIDRLRNTAIVRFETDDGGDMVFLTTAEAQAALQAPAAFVAELDRLFAAALLKDGYQ